jgi:hypothetical protein
MWLNMGNRIGSTCFWWTIVSPGVKESRRGRLLAWSTDFEELRHGVGQYPVGVVEDCETRHVHVVHASMISFANPQT